MRTLASVLLLFGLAGHVGADELLVQQEPFDQITLVEQYGNAVMKLKTLDLPGRERPKEPQPTDKLTVQLLDEPEKSYEVQWGAIAKLELFEELVLAEAKALVAAGRLDEAYDSFRYLEGNHPKVAGLAAAVEDFLFEEAKASMRRRDYAGTLAMLGELFARNPKRPGLEMAMSLATEKAVEQHVAAGRYTAARRLWRQLGERFPGQVKAIAGEEQLKQQATGLLEKSRAAASQNDFALATRLCREVEEIWPAAPGAKSLAETLHAKWPMVAVGYVGAGGTRDSVASWYADWGARRDSRLVDRPLCEFVGPAVGGGAYRCAVGELPTDKAAPALTIKLAAGQPAVGPSDVVQQFLAVLESPAARATWDAYGFSGVTPTSESEVTVTWSREHFKPEALVATLSRTELANATPALFRPFRVAAGNVLSYELNPAYFGAIPTTPRQITLKHFESSAAAVRALRRGQISAVDRLSAIDAARLAGDKRFVVAPYRVPLMHALVANVRRGLTADRDFRRGLLYAIDRAAIIETIQAGEKSPDFRILSGPFPLGIGPDDPLRYACDPKIEPRPYDPSLAVTLVEAASRRLLPQDGKKPVRPRLVVAHPADALAQTACAAIADQLGLIGVELSLRPLARMPSMPPDDCDLMYVAYPVCEPMVEAETLLGEHGLSGSCSPACGLYLRRLAEAGDFRQAQASLYALHRLVYDEMTMLPLWQRVEYWACRAELGRVGTPTVSLYDNVEQWQPVFTWSEQ